MELCVNPYKNLGECRAKRVNQYIPEARVAKRHKGLMPFIQTGVAHGDEEGNDRPIESPTVPVRSNAVKNSDTEEAELSYVGRFSNSEMHHSQRVTARRWEKPSKYGNNKAPSLLGTEVVGRKQRDQYRDSNRREPVFKTRNHLEVFNLGVGLQRCLASAKREISGRNHPVDRIARSRLVLDAALRMICCFITRSCFDVTRCLGKPVEDFIADKNTDKVSNFLPSRC
jgi:hypothetical protein